MGQTNLRASLKKRYSQLKGQRADLALRVEAVRRDAARLDEMEAELPRFDQLIEATELLLRDNDPDFDPNDTPALPVSSICFWKGYSVVRLISRPTVQL